MGLQPQHGASVSRDRRLGGLSDAASGQVLDGLDDWHAERFRQHRGSPDLLLGIKVAEALAIVARLCGDPMSGVQVHPAAGEHAIHRMRERTRISPSTS